MKRNKAHAKPQSIDRKTAKQQRKFPIKLKSKKSYENTASTLGSRSSMESKITLSRPNNYVSYSTPSSTGLTRQRKSLGHQQNLTLPLAQNSGQKQYENDEGNISYRQYCMVGDKWIPLLTSTQRQRIICPLKQKDQNTIVEKPIIKSCIPIAVPQFTTTPNIDTFQQTLLKLKQQTNKDGFLQLKGESKNYYYQILKNVMEKLKLSPNQTECQQNSCVASDKVLNIPVNTLQIEPTSCGKISQQHEDISPVKSFVFQNQFQSIKLPVVPQMIKMRELQQFGMIPFVKGENNQSSDMINTSIQCIEQYISNLMETIVDGKVAPYIVAHIKTAWGWPKKQKLAKLRSKKYLGSAIDVLPDYLFQLIQDTFGNDCLYQFIHNRCLFDYLNMQLCKLKPFYDSNGQTFPWNFKLSAPLTFFQVQQNSLGLAIDEAKAKLFQSCNMLCGLIVDIGLQHQQYPILQKRRQERQDNMCRKYMLAEQFRKQQQNAIQNQTTLTLLGLSDKIMQDLFVQFPQFFGL